MGGPLGRVEKNSGFLGVAVGLLLGGCVCGGQQGSKNNYAALSMPRDGFETLDVMREANV
jgi:hypothetical protein